MKTVADQIFEGERAQFKARDTKYAQCRFQNGESPLKEGRNIVVSDCVFDWKYPMWYGDNYQVSDSLMTTTARAGIWYTNDSSFKNLKVEAPKSFRMCKNIILEDIEFTSAQETLWWNENVVLKNIRANGDYLCMRCKNVKVDNLHLDGNYSFDTNENVEIANSFLNTKDAFWNCKNVTVRNSTIIGEYFGWNSENITLIDCNIESLQGFCYIKKLTLINCRCNNTSLSFEYCKEVDAEIIGPIESIKNPISGIIKVKEVGEIILDDDEVDHSKTRIIVDGKEIR